MALERHLNMKSKKWIHLTGPQSLCHERDGDQMEQGKLGLLVLLFTHL